MNTITLTDLPGRKGKTRALGFRSVAAALTAIRKGFAATAASDDGAINIWRTRTGELRAERYRYMMTCATFDGKTKSKLREWLATQLPLIERK